MNPLCKLYANNRTHNLKFCVEFGLKQFRLDSLLFNCNEIRSIPWGVGTVARYHSIWNVT